MTGRIQLQRAILTRREDGLWDVVRERASGGESIRGCKDLDEALDAVRAHDPPAPREPSLTYVQNGKGRPHILDPMLTRPPRTTCGLKVVVETWTFGVEGKGLCANCERMRGSALEHLRRMSEAT
jgi:hypothetical protein